MAGISISSTTTSSATLFLSSLDKSWTNGTRTAYWYRGSAGGGIPTESVYSDRKTASIPNAVEEGGEVTFSGLEAGTRYGIYCEVYHGSTFLTSLQGYVTTSAEETTTWLQSTLGSSSLATTKITASISVKPYRLYLYSVSFANSGTAIFYTTGKTVDTYGYLTTHASSEGGVPKTPILDESDTIYEDSLGGDDGLNFSISYPVEKGKIYRIWVRSYSGDQTGSAVLHIIPPEVSSTTIEKWSWSASNGNASATLTSTAYTAITSNGSTKNFSYKVWNDMVDKVKEIMDEAVGWWDIDYETYANTKMTASGETLTAVMFNSLRNNLEIAGYQKLGLNKTGIGPVSSGATVYGHYFTTLTDYMNACIDNLP